MKHALTTIPEIARCPRCRKMILTGHDDGLPYRVEVDPLNRAGEVSAVLDGLTTYQMITQTLAHRDSHRMAHSADHEPVFVTHYCSRLIPAHHRNTHLPETLHARIHAHAAHAARHTDPPF